MHGQVVIIARQGRIIAAELDLALSIEPRDRDRVTKRKRCHQRLDFVESIRPPPENPEGKINLRRSAQLDRVHHQYRMKNLTSGKKEPRERLIIALDFPERGQAFDLVSDLGGEVGFYKIGLQLYTAAGPEIVGAIATAGAKIFLDLKLHDIPATVGKAVSAAGDLGVNMATIHLSGGREMIEAAVAACSPELLLLGVTVLTSSDENTLRETGVGSGVEEQTLRLAELGAAAGVHGLIASPHELEALRNRFGEEMTIVTPGVRPSWSAAGDQKRFTTPREAIECGADYLVIGRPVTGDPEPRNALQRILDELA